VSGLQNKFSGRRISMTIGLGKKMPKVKEYYSVKETMISVVLAAIY
jgi:hypothetical protein